MEVETFECLELAEETHPEINDESLRLIEELGLDGQKPKEVDGEKRRIPYQIMTTEQFRVYKALCPMAYTPKEYKRSPIPLRVLQVMAHAKPLFGKLEIWDVEDSTIKDPVLVGTIDASYDTSTYLLARWGAELDEFFCLRKRALQALKDRAASDLKKVEVKVKGLLANIEVMEMDDFPWGWQNSPERYSLNGDS